MFRGFLISIVLGSLSFATVRGQEAPAQFYLNKGNVTNAQVNAINFINEGRFSISSSVPWDPQNTINFTNRGTISGSVGFRFETVEGGFGARHQALSFYNAPNARILALDGGGLFLFNGGLFVGGTFAPNASFVDVNAASVTNRGDITVGANGVMKLFARDMDLTGGSLIVEDTIAAAGTFGPFFNADVTETNFFPSTGVYDLAFGIDVSTNMPVAGIIRSANPNNIVTPFFFVTNSLSAGAFAQICQTRFGLTNAQVWLRDERLNDTNEVIQLVAVDTTDTNINVSASFYDQVLPFGTTQGGFLSPVVEFRVVSTNFRTLDLQTNSLNVFDQLGSHTNYTLTTNLVAGTLRPAPIILFRSGPGLGEGGQPATTRFITPDLFDSPLFSNRFVTNQYAIYSSEIQSVASRLPTLPDVGITNLPGRVEINATNLKFDNTRIRGEGLISINATNLSGGQASILDASRITMNFTSTTNVLNLKDMTPDNVERFGGFLQIFSGIWTNLVGEVSGTGTNAVTNVIELRFQLLAISGRDLHTREPVIAHQLNLRSPGSVIYEDNLSVSNLVQISAPNLTLGEGSRLYLSKGIGFSYTNIQNVSTFTNLGTLQLNELAELRRNETTGYDSFVNRGDIIAFGTEITANYFESSGDIVSSNFYTLTGTGGGFFTSDCFGRPSSSTVAGSTEGAITINAGTAKIDAGNFKTDGDIRFRGNVFKVNNHSAAAGGRMVFDVTDVLTDSGEHAGNVWVLNNGFVMGGAHPAGDLLGTEIRTVAAKLAFVDNSWSSEERGPTVAGFTDNAALGRLVLRGDTGSRFQILPGAPNSALYVDVLQLEGIQAASVREFTNRVQLGMNVYFGNIESTNGTLSAERLNRILGPNAPYNFIWVPEWAGPNSGVDVPLTETGPVRRFNRPLRESVNIDSDGDGLPNKFDPFPFPPEAFGITGITLNPVSQAVSFGFPARTAGTYVIEYSTNLATPNWQSLTQVEQTNLNGGIMSFTDEVKAGDPQRYYRVRKAP